MAGSNGDPLIDPRKGQVEDDLQVAELPTHVVQQDRIRVLERSVDDRRPPREEVHGDVELDAFLVERVHPAVVDGVVVVGGLEGQGHEPVLLDEVLGLGQGILRITQRIDRYLTTEPFRVLRHLLGDPLVGDVDAVVAGMVRMRGGSTDVAALHDRDVDPGVVDHVHDVLAIPGDARAPVRQVHLLHPPLGDLARRQTDVLMAVDGNHGPS